MAHTRAWNSAQNPDFGEKYCKRQANYHRSFILENQDASQDTVDRHRRLGQAWRAIDNCLQQVDSHIESTYGHSSPVRISFNALTAAIQAQSKKNSNFDNIVESYLGLIKSVNESVVVNKSGDGCLWYWLKRLGCALLGAALGAGVGMAIAPVAAGAAAGVAIGSLVGFFGGRHWLHSKEQLGLQPLPAGILQPLPKNAPPAIHNLHKTMTELEGHFLSHDGFSQCYYDKLGLSRNRPV